VWRAKDGLEAIKYLGASGEYGNREKFPMPDVMLLDLQMPRKDGWEVLEWLKDQPVKPIVVVLTILENPASRKKALGLGADEFQVKPYDEDGLKQFLTWLKDLVREARQRTA
jgi:CheY-like chemotaxis protein